MTQENHYPLWIWRRTPKKHCLPLLLEIDQINQDQSDRWESRGRGKMDLSSNPKWVVIFLCHVLWENKIWRNFSQKVIFGGLHPKKLISLNFSPKTKILNIQSHITRQYCTQIIPNGYEWLYMDKLIHHKWFWVWINLSWQLRGLAAAMSASCDISRPRCRAQAKAGVWRSQAPAWNF